MQCIVTMRQTWRRAWRAWLARVQRDGAGIALLLLLALGLFEPFACILHSTLWVELFQRSMLTQHTHLMRLPDGTITIMSDTIPMQHQHPMLLPTGTLIMMDDLAMMPAHTRPNNSSLEIHATLKIEQSYPPSIPSAVPFHEMVLLAATLLSVLIPCREYFAPSLRIPPLVFLRPPLRPPISCC